MKNNFWLWLNAILIGLLVGMMVTCSNVNSENVQLKQRNDALHNQLTRTQYQLKRAKKQNVEQTQKIAELTRNGG
ncbi:hypothetical protein CGZ53_07885 [Streptococcus uberis]|uniref:hypothetical protein n=1 Tax=Streptococcus uberis TaxID=1349 RepID=UPI000C2D2B15|nr:hypothetical protein [Streptococcus uberis]AUC25573.1 hypothetical protein CGZ53_07885 [Streptococcus uberis]